MSESLTGARQQGREGEEGQDGKDEKEKHGKKEKNDTKLKKLSVCTASFESEAPEKPKHAQIYRNDMRSEPDLQTLNCAVQVVWKKEIYRQDQPKG